MPSNKQFDLGADGQVHGSLGMMAEPHDRLMAAAQEQPLWANLGESAVRMSTVWPHCSTAGLRQLEKAAGGRAAPLQFNFLEGRRAGTTSRPPACSEGGITRYTASCGSWTSATWEMHVPKQILLSLLIFIFPWSLGEEI